MFELDLNSVHVEVEYIARVEQLHAESQFFAGVWCCNRKYIQQRLPWGLTVTGLNLITLPIAS